MVPFQDAALPETNPLPLICSVNAAEPADTVRGATDVTTGTAEIPVELPAAVPPEDPPPQPSKRTAREDTTRRLKDEEGRAGTGRRNIVSWRGSASVG